MVPRRASPRHAAEPPESPRRWQQLLRTRVQLSLMLGGLALLAVASNLGFVAGAYHGPSSSSGHILQVADILSTIKARRAGGGASEALAAG